MSSQSGPNLIALSVLLAVVPACDLATDAAERSDLAGTQQALDEALVRLDALEADAASADLLERVSAVEESLDRAVKGYAYSVGSDFLEGFEPNALSNEEPGAGDWITLDGELGPLEIETRGGAVVATATMHISMLPEMSGTGAASAHDALVAFEVDGVVQDPCLRPYVGSSAFVGMPCRAILDVSPGTHTISVVFVPRGDDGEITYVGTGGFVQGASGDRPEYPIPRATFTAIEL